MICDCPKVIQYVVEARENNIELMNEAQYADVFYYHKGKVYAYNEILRVLQDD